MATKEDIANSEKQKVIERLVEKKKEFDERLTIGAEKIEEARSQGKDVSSWEDYWIQLLRNFEAVCDKLQELGYTEAKQ